MLVERPVPWDHHRVIEYGGGISEGPAGQVAGGSHVLGQGGDPLGTLSQLANDAVNTISSLSPAELALGIVIVFVGLIILRRAF